MINNKRNASPYIVNGIFLLCILGLSINWGLRSFDTGADTVTYVRIFNLMDSNIDFGIERGFIEYMSFVRVFTLDPHVFLLVTSLLTTVFLLISAKIILPSNGMHNFIIFLIVSPFFQSMSINVIRQGLGLSIALLVFAVSVRLKNYNLFLAIFAVSIVSLIHLPTALVIIPLFLFKIRRPFLIWTACVFVSYFSDFYSSSLTPYLIGRYEAYANSSDGYQTGFRMSFVLLSLFPYIVYIFIPKAKFTDNLKNVLEKYTVMNGVGLLFNFLPYFDRFLLTSWIIMPYIFSLAINNSWTGKITTTVFLKTVILYSVVLAAFAAVYISTSLG